MAKTYSANKKVAGKIDNFSCHGNHRFSRHLLITHRIDTTLTLTILTNLVSTTTYFIHERVWNRIQWGRVS